MAILECDDEEENVDQSRNGETEEINSSSRSPRTLDQSENDDDEDRREEEEAEDEELAKSRRSSQGLKIKLSLSIKPPRKTSREPRSRVCCLLLLLCVHARVCVTVCVLQW